MLCKLISSIKSVVFTMLISFTAANAAAQPNADLPIPYMPASPQKVLADIGAPADVQAVVTGGWGYTRPEPTVLGNPYHGKSKFFDVQAFEADLIDLRNMEEFYTVPGDGSRYLPLKFLIIKQTTHTEAGGRRLDEINAEVDLLPEEYWADLNDLSAQKATEEQIFAFFHGKLKTVKRTYWFDITQPFMDNKQFYANPLE